MNTEKFEVRNRWTNAVQFTAEIECKPDASIAVKLGLAVRWGVAQRANLRGANLQGANLRSFQSDFWMTLTMARPEIPAFIEKLKAGEISGSQYEGDCACLVGTISNIRGVNYRDAFPDASGSNPAEQWFLMISKGNKPGDASPGGYAAGKALEWALEYCSLTGIELGEVA